MDEATARVTVDKEEPGYWRVTLDHPPINTIDDLMYDEVVDLVQAIEAEQGLKVVTFESADPDYFLAHYGVGESQSRFGAPRWRDAAIQLAHSNVLSIAVIRGRARGGGSEFALGCDVRFASRERAIFGQPDVGFGLIPGGGATERLPLLVGRSRAIEIVLGGDDFDADTAEKMAGSTEPSRKRSSTTSSMDSSGACCRSTVMRWRPPSNASTRHSCPTRRIYRPRGWRLSKSWVRRPLRSS